VRYRWQDRNRFKFALTHVKCTAKKKGYSPCYAAYDEISLAFTGKCSACGKAEIENGRKLSLDHCHTTGKFRGWLCDECNKALGMVGDSKERLVKLIAYLDSTKELMEKTREEL
jgi:hypothetical protein